MPSCARKYSRPSTAQSDDHGWVMILKSLKAESRACFIASKSSSNSLATTKLSSQGAANTRPLMACLHFEIAHFATILEIVCAIKRRPSPAHAEALEPHERALSSGAIEASSKELSDVKTNWYLIEEAHNIYCLNKICICAFSYEDRHVQNWHLWWAEANSVQWGSINHQSGQRRDLLLWHLEAFELCWTPFRQFKCVRAFSRSCRLAFWIGEYMYPEWQKLFAKKCLFP